MVDDYTEGHHIIPRCMGGRGKGNIVRLTFREHFLVHWLLIKFVEEKYEHRMHQALIRMGQSHLQPKRTVTSWQFDRAKRAHRERGFSVESREKIRLALTGQKRSPEIRRQMKLTWQKMPPEAKKAHSEKLRAEGRRLWREDLDYREKMLEKLRRTNKRMRGKKVSLVTRARLSKALRGRKYIMSEKQRKIHSTRMKILGSIKLHCEHCGTIACKGMLARFHGNRCKSLRNEFLASNVALAAMGFGA